MEGFEGEGVGRQVSSQFVNTLLGPLASSALFPNTCVRLYRNSGIRITARDLDYANEIDYSEFGKGSGTNRSSRPDKGKRTTHRFRPYRSPEFKDAAITSNDLTPQKMNDSGYLSIPNTLHRPVNQFFLGPGKPIYFDAEVLMLWDNVGILLSEDEVSSDGTAPSFFQMRRSNPH